MSAVGAIGTRFLATVSLYTRGALARAGTGNVVVVALAAATLIYSWRHLKRNGHSERRRGGGERPRGNSAASRRQREHRRGKLLAGVHKVTIGTDARSVSGTIFELREAIDNSFPGIGGVHAVEKDDGDEIEPVNSSVDFLPDATVAGATTCKELKMKQEVVPHLRQFAALFNLYLIVRVDSDEDEEMVKKSLSDENILKWGLDPLKVVFCETTDGRASIARQIEPDMHIDESRDVVSGLQRFVKFVALVSPDAKSSHGLSGNNILKYASLAKFFQVPGSKS